jgi:hypothetical protein
MAQVNPSQTTKRMKGWAVIREKMVRNMANRAMSDGYMIVPAELW